MRTIESRPQVLRPGPPAEIVRSEQGRVEYEITLQTSDGHGGIVRREEQAIEDVKRLRRKVVPVRDEAGIVRVGRSLAVLAARSLTVAALIGTGRSRRIVDDQNAVRSYDSKAGQRFRVIRVIHKGRRFTGFVTHEG
jgi:hypothetical protein